MPGFSADRGSVRFSNRSRQDVLECWSAQSVASEGQEESQKILDHLSLVCLGSVALCLSLVESGISVRGVRRTVVSPEATRSGRNDEKKITFWSETGLPRKNSSPALCAIRGSASLSGGGSGTAIGRLEPDVCVPTKTTTLTSISQPVFVRAPVDGPRIIVSPKVPWSAVLGFPSLV